MLGVNTLATLLIWMTLTGDEWPQKQASLTPKPLFLWLHLFWVAAGILVRTLITATLGSGLSVGLWVLWTLSEQEVGHDGQDQWIIFEHPSQESYFQWALKECQCAKLLKGMVSFICLKLGWAYRTPNEIMLQFPDNVPNLYLAWLCASRCVDHWSSAH